MSRWSGSRPKLATKSAKGRSDNAQAFHEEWSKFIHRVKVHELLRCLENEQKKLKVLREHGDLNKLITGVGLPEKKPSDSKSTSRTSIKSNRSAEIVKQIKSSDKVSESATTLFKTSLEVTDEQFEQILQLCKDRAEQKQLRAAFEEKRKREKYLRNASERKRMLYEFMNSHFFNRFLLFLIACSTLIIVLLTFEYIEIRYTLPLRICDSIIIGVFLVEACCKISIYKLDYFKSVWNILDLSIIITHFVEILVELITKIMALNTNINGSLVFRLLKSLRSLRLLRAIKFMPNLQVTVSTIFESMLSLSSIATLMMIIMVVFAVVGRGLFKDNDPRHFNSIWSSMLTLFQLLTLDDWFDLPDDYDKGEGSKTYYVFIVYLFIYILFEFFVFLNLFVAVLVDNFQLSTEEAKIVSGSDVIDFDNVESIGLAAEEEEEIDKAYGLDETEGADLKIDDYYGIDPESEEMKLMAENLKIMSSVDFEYYMFTRRSNLVGIVMDAVVAAKQNTWTVQDALEYRFGDEIESLLPHEPDKNENAGKETDKTVKPKDKE